MRFTRYIKKGIITLKEYWESSKLLSLKYKERSRFYFFLDILGCTLKYGANDADYMMFDYYDKTQLGRNLYITWLRTFKIQKKIDPRGMSELLNKPTFNNKFNEYLKRAWQDCSESSTDQIKEFIITYKKVIAKPANSALGRGIRILSDSLKNEDIDVLHKEKYILEEFLENAPETRRLNPSSLNTIRIVTASTSSGEISVLSSILRIGLGDGITDNLCTGGIACAIDSKTGKLSGSAKNVKGDCFKAHPITGIVFDGYIIPYYQQALDIVLELCHKIPYARYVGWDIAITTRGVCLIEGNMPPSEETTEFSSNGQWNKLLHIISR